MKIQIDFTQKAIPDKDLALSLQVISFSFGGLPKQNYR